MKKILNTIIIILLVVIIISIFFSPIIVAVLTKDPVWLVLFAVSWIPTGALCLFLFAITSFLYDESI